LSGGGISIIDEASHTIVIGYDPANRVTSVKDQNDLTTRYIYNGFGELIQLQSPDAGTKTLWRDAAGNLQRKVDANQDERVYTYDAINRIKTFVYPGQTAHNLTFFYDETSTFTKANKGVGRLTRVQQNDGLHVGYPYNTLGQIVEQIQVMAGRNDSVGYQYDSQGRLSSMTALPISMRATSWTWVWTTIRSAPISASATNCLACLGDTHHRSP
jgi:YD repeat-containing protein